MFKNPTISNGMIGWFVWGAINLARTIEYAVQAGWSLIVSFIRLLSLTGFRAAESGIDCRVIGIVTVASMLVPIASGLAVAISGFRGVGVACIVFATGQPTIIARAKAGHECREAAIDFGFSWPSWRTSHS